MPVRMTHDPEADAVFIKIADAHSIESEEVAPGVVLDFAEDGRVTGIEILLASKTLAPGRVVGMADARLPKSARR